MSLKYEPSSEPLHISAKWLFLGIKPLGTTGRGTAGFAALFHVDRLHQGAPPLPPPPTHMVVPTYGRSWGSFNHFFIRKVDVRLPGKGNSDSHGARPVHLIITMIKWIRTSRLSIKNSLSLNHFFVAQPPGIPS